MDQVLCSPRGWSMRHGHRQFLVECSGRSSFSKSAASAKAWKKQESCDEEANCFDVKSSKAKVKNKRKNGNLKHQPLAWDWLEEDWLEEDSSVLAGDPENAIVQPMRLALVPRSLAEESELLQRALRESEDEANLQRAIQESEEEADLQKAICASFHQSQTYISEVPDSPEIQTSRPEGIGLLRQRSAPCIAREVADADARMDRVYVPLTAWHSASPAPHKCSTTPWDQAVKRAASVAERYSFQHVRTEPSQPAKRSVPSSGAAEGSLRTYPMVPICGQPPAAVEHSCVLKFAVPKAETGFPACWEPLACASLQRRVRSIGVAARRKVVSPSSQEYQAVTDYFNATVFAHGAGIQVQELVRLQNPHVYQHFRAGGELDTIMFHGCKSQFNEDSIIANGFQVKRCVSGGPEFGTWFAYGAAYSNNGYVFVDAEGVRHLFVCVVSPQHVVLDNSTMRVVGQGCAYPLWLLKYKYHTLPSQTPSQTTFSAKGGATPSARQFFVVKNGAWVLE
eukprot:TRINITY_DN14630_c0_g1_i1.p1 TRINITY_DN14630_c0_g1~~TRINITY_DN14630_c0_g1_i1.p1  ORF type:complete len:509 (-),score=71.33 TRINITY_DN14630_c0_g1_i1:272-1798(-)